MNITNRNGHATCAHIISDSINRRPWSTGGPVNKSLKVQYLELFARASAGQIECDLGLIEVSIIIEVSLSIGIRVVA